MKLSQPLSGNSVGVRLLLLLPLPLPLLLLLLSSNSYVERRAAAKFRHLTLFLDSSLTVLQLFPFYLSHLSFSSTSSLVAFF
jgi:hypothetical protein